MRAAHACIRPGIMDRIAMRNKIPPQVRHKKTPIFQSIKGHSRLNQALHENCVAAVGNKWWCALKSTSVMLSNSDLLICPSPLVSKWRSMNSLGDKEPTCCCHSCGRLLVVLLPPPPPGIVVVALHLGSKKSTKRRPAVLNHNLESRLMRWRRMGKDEKRAGKS